MTLPQSLGAYKDCFAILDQALANPRGLLLRFNTKSEAQYMRSRIYYGRKLEQLYSPEGSTDYDHLYITIEEGDGWWLVIRPRAAPKEIIAL
jgi:hypothetical protein